MVDVSKTWEYKGIQNILVITNTAVHVSSPRKSTKILQIHVKNYPGYNIMGKTERCMKFISDALSLGQTVLINSPPNDHQLKFSCAVTIAYLMHSEKMYFETALNHIQ
jgi:hypothetical protein